MGVHQRGNAILEIKPVSTCALCPSSCLPVCLCALRTDMLYVRLVAACYPSRHFLPSELTARSSLVSPTLSVCQTNVSSAADVPLHSTTQAAFPSTREFHILMLPVWTMELSLHWRGSVGSSTSLWGGTKFRATPPPPPPKPR